MSVYGCVSSTFPHVFLLRILPQSTVSVVESLLPVHLEASVSLNGPDAPPPPAEAKPEAPKASPALYVPKAAASRGWEKPAVVEQPPPLRPAAAAAAPAPGESRPSGERTDLK